MRIKYRSDYPGEKRAHSRALAAPQRFPMKGDSPSTRVTAMRGARYASLIPSLRAALVEARYSDWQQAREAYDAAAN